MVFLHPHEEAYTAFLTLRNVPLTELPRQHVDTTPENAGSPALAPSTDPLPDHQTVPDETLEVAPRHALEPVSVFAQVQALAMKDRDMYDKGKVAFVSFVRGYKEHQCSYIFQSKDLEFGRLATGFGLVC